MSPKITPAKALRIDNCFKSSKFIVLTPPPIPLPQGAGEILYSAEIYPLKAVYAATFGDAK